MKTGFLNRAILFSAAIFLALIAFEPPLHIHEADFGYHRGCPACQWLFSSLTNPAVILLATGLFLIALLIIPSSAGTSIIYVCRDENRGPPARVSL